MQHFNINSIDLPSKFSAWRENQEEAFLDIINSKKRFQCHVHPTGAGKTLICLAVASYKARVLNERTVILTSTIALQEQIAKDFQGLVTIVKGMANYSCKDKPGTKCNTGKCKVGIKCSLKEFDCDYYNQLHKARNSQIVVINYACYMALNKYGNKLGHFDNVVLDEAHSAPEWIYNAMEIRISQKDLKDIISEEFPLDTIDGDNTDFQSVKSWFQHMVIPIENAVIKYKESENASNKAFQAVALEKQVKELLDIEGNWMCVVENDKSSGKSVKVLRIAPLEPAGDFASRLIFLNSEKIYLTSATVNKKTLSMLGIVDYDFKEYPTTFPLENRPIYHIPTCYVSRTTSKNTLEYVWAPRVFQIVETMLDRKGLIHVPSYDKCDLLLKVGEAIESVAGGFIFSHNRGEVYKAVQRFKRTHDPAVLISPCIRTGYDFPDTEAEYQIISKLQYPFMGDPVLRARANIDPGLIDYLTLQELVQTVGRGMRSKDDTCSTYIIDDCITDFIMRNTGNIPDWFMELYQVSKTIPKPLPKIGSKESKSYDKELEEVTIEDIY